MLWSSSEAARRVDAGARARDTMRRRRESLLMKREEPGELDSGELLQLSKGESMKELRKATDAHGTTVERMEEEYQGIPVFDSAVTVRKDEHGKLTGDASGVLIQDISEDLPDTTPKLTDEETLEIVIRAEGDRGKRNLISDVKFSEYIYLDKNDKARLVNQVTYLIDGEKKPMYIIDLKTGEILKHWNSFMTLACCSKSGLKTRVFGGNERTGKVWYGSQPYCLDFTVDSCDKCYLENKYVRVVDMMQSKNETINQTASFPCNQLYGDEVNGAYSPAIDAFYYGTVVGKMFEEWYNEKPLHEKIVIRVHYGELYSNAFWNSVNATFGDGGFDMYPLVSLDVVGHEIGHGVVEQGSGLLYYDEMGGMNEAFADIMGEASEAFVLKSDFLTGNNIMKMEKYLREFETPANDNASIGHASQMTPDMDPHLSSGVYRRIWYVLIKEQQLDIRTAFNVFKYANEMYWHYMSTFYDGSCGLLRAAMDLGVRTEPFVAAFEDVGIPLCNVSGHIFSVSNNKTQRGVVVSSSSEPVFAFTMPAWGASLLVEAITPSGGPYSVNIKVYRGSWEEEEFEKSILVKSGTDKLTFDVVNIIQNSSGSFESYRDTTDSDWYPTDAPDVGGSTTPSGYVNTDGDIILNGTDVIYGATEPTPTQRADTQFFIKLEPEWYLSYNDVELTVGYTCVDDYSPGDMMQFMIYRYYCFGEYDA